MSKTFLVAIDGSDHAWKALDLAADLAKVSDAVLSILHVVPYEPMSEGLRHFARIEGIPIEEEKARYHASKAAGDGLTTEAAARVRAAGIERVTTHVAEGNPADQIVELARAESADMVLVGSRGLGDIKGLLMGSISHKVMHLAPCTCVAVK